MAYDKLMVFQTIYEHGDWEDFKNFCHYMYATRFISIFNSGLIYLQRPGAEFVHTRRQWEKMGRYIQSYASPIIITVPFGPVEFLYDYSDTYGREIGRMSRKSFLPPPPVSFKEVNPLFVRHVLELMGIHYSEAGNFGQRLKGLAERLPNPIEFDMIKNKKKTHIRTRYAITVNSKLQDFEKVCVIFHEIGHVLCSHLYTDPSVEKDNLKNVVKTPPRLLKNLNHYIEEYEAETVCSFLCKFLGYEYEHFNYLDQIKKEGSLSEAHSSLYIASAVNTFLLYWDEAKRDNYVSLYR